MLPKRLKSAGFFRNTSGAVAFVYALALPALIGFAGLGAEVGYWYVSKRALQSAADAGATAAALELTYGGNSDDIHAQTVAEASRNGFKGGAGTTLQINNPPLGGAYAGDSTAIEVILGVRHSPMFAAIVDDNDVDIRARAVARQVPGGDACILALDPSAHDAVANSGSAVLDVDGCIVASNSKQDDAISLGGSSALHADSLWTSGKVDQGSNATVDIKTSPVEQGYPLDDPYAGTPIPATTMPCVKAKNIGGVMMMTTAGPGFPTTICTPGATVHLVGGDDVDFGPGVYIFDNVSLKIDAGASVTCSACTPGGEGVTFIFTGDSASQVGTVDINGSATVQLNAPSEGTYAGLLFYQDPIAPHNSSHASTLNGGANIALTGALYFPSTDVSMNGDLTGGAKCTILVSATVTFGGNSTLNTSKCKDYGYKTVTSIRVALVE